MREELIRFFRSAIRRQLNIHVPDSKHVLVALNTYHVCRAACNPEIILAKFHAHKYYRSVVKDSGFQVRYDRICIFLFRTGWEHYAFHFSGLIFNQKSIELFLFCLRVTRNHIPDNSKNIRIIRTGRTESSCLFLPVLILVFFKQRSDKGCVLPILVVFVKRMGSRIESEVFRFFLQKLILRKFRKSLIKRESNCSHVKE